MSSSCPTVKIKPSHPSQGDFVEINQEDFDEAKHERFVPPAPGAPVEVPPPPPAPPSDPLANLPENWREGDVSTLRALAATVSGRTPENERQAIELIEQALASKK